MAKFETLGEELDAILSASGLSEKRQLFIAEYLTKPNATKAAKAAGYSAETASRQGSRLLSNGKIRAVLRDCKRLRAKNLGTTKVDQIAYWAEVRDDPKESRRDRNHAAKEISRLEGHYNDKISLNVTGSLAERMVAARERKAT